MFSKDRDKAIELFTGHTNEGNENVFLDYEDAADDGRTIFDERSARDFIASFLRERNRELELSVLVENRILRDELIRELKQKSNLSVRQIAGLLGVNRGAVQRVKA